MTNEIGSEFWDSPLLPNKNTLFPPETRWFLSGRSAEAYILADILSMYDVHTAALPSWCCGSMIKPFLDAGLDVRFYPVVIENDRLVQYPRYDCDILFVMDYFGYTSNYDISPFKGIVIRDVTHSLLSESRHDADYYFGSLRKWTGLSTGGFAISNRFTENVKVNRTNEKYVQLRKQARKEKGEYLSGKRNDKEYLRLFADAEDMLDRMNEICAADDDDITAAYCLDIEGIRLLRRENACQLLRTFSDIAVFPKLNENDCPLFVPILVPCGKRDSLCRYLVENRIYCPIHWPISKYYMAEQNKKERMLYDNEISLICDQRYNSDDMDRIVNTIKKYFSEA